LLLLFDGLTTLYFLISEPNSYFVNRDCFPAFRPVQIDQGSDDVSSPVIGSDIIEWLELREGYPLSKLPKRHLAEHPTYARLAELEGQPKRKSSIAAPL
jgi:hypothetical protein